MIHGGVFLTAALDETDISLSNDGDKGGPRSKTYINPDFPRLGGSGCRGGQRHNTSVLGTTATYKTMPPLFIFDTSAEKLENQKIHTKWVEGLPKVSGRYGCPTT